MSELHDLVAHWFEKRRGIRRETVEAFGIYTEGNDVVIPYPEGMLKRRYSLEKDENPFGLDKAGRRFSWQDAQGNTGKAGQVPFLPPDYEPREWVILVPEGETDTMALWQNIPAEARDKVAVIGLSGVGSFRSAILGQDKGGAQMRPNRVEELFGAAKKVFVVLDNEDPYENPEGVASVEDAWGKIKSALGRKARRVTLPQGQKDLAEFFLTYDWAAFRELLIEASRPRMNFPRLDLSKDPPQVNWLVEGLIADRDITLLTGDGGVSKSLWMQALAVAIANGTGEFMGAKIPAGRVLYVDQENPQDVAMSRLKKLGLTPEGMENLYYVWYGGVNLAGQPERLYEDVMEFEPCTTMLDSFARVTLSADANDAITIDQVFDRSLFPITRELVVPVLVLHHLNKDGGIRGSVQLRNNSDLTVEFVRAKQGKQELIDTYTMFPDKPRRGQKRQFTYRVTGYDASGEITDDIDAEARIALEPLYAEEAM